MNPQRCKTVVGLLSGGLIVALGACAFLGYLLIDRTVTISYLDASNQTNVQALQRLGGLLESEWSNISENELLEKLEAEARRRPSESILVKAEPDENFIWFDNLRFELESNKLKKIAY